MADKIPYTDIAERIKSDIDYVAEEAYRAGFRDGYRDGKKIAETIQKSKEEELRCGLCGELDYSCMYASDPPQYKCEKYGCLVRITDECKGGKH